MAHLYRQPVRHPHRRHRGRRWPASIPRTSCCTSTSWAAASAAGSNRDMVVPAVLASKAVGKPVKLIYAREDDMEMDFTRPLTYQKVKVGLDADGKPIAMEHDVVCAWPTARWGIPAFLTPVGRQEGHRSTASPSTAPTIWYTMPNHTVRNDPERAGAEGDAVRPAPLGGAGLDLLGGRKHDRRDRPCVRQGPGRLRLRCSTARRQCGGDKPQKSAAPRISPTCCARPSAAPAMARSSSAEERGNRRRLRQLAGARHRDLDGLRRPCRRSTRRAASSRSRS